MDHFKERWPIGLLIYAPWGSEAVYIVKKLGKNGIWNAVSLIDENGSFRGEARFETKKEADKYLARYISRMKNPAAATVDGKPVIKVFKEANR